MIRFISLVATMILIGCDQSIGAQCTPDLIKIGMTTDEVVQHCGSPEKKNKTMIGSAVKEQWVYGSGSYVYLTNGHVDVISWQEIKE